MCDPVLNSQQLINQCAFSALDSALQAIRFCDMCHRESVAVSVYMVGSTRASGDPIHASFEAHGQRLELPRR